MERFLASLPSRPQPLWIRIGVTLIIMALSALIQMGVLRSSGFDGFFLLLPGIFASGVLFDRGSAFFATLLALGLAAYVARSAEAYEEVIPLVLFGLTGLAIAFVSEALRTTMEKLHKAERTKDVLLREIDHRTKNNMMNVASVLRLQARVASQGETKEALRGFANRIRVMANVQDHLTPSSPNREVNMSRYLEELCRRIEELDMRSAVTIRCKVDESVLAEKKACLWHLLSMNS
jgi:two-component system, sensor histidine kinase PdtaS